MGVNPGGSGKLDDLGFEAGVESRSTTHFGRGGGKEVLRDAIVDIGDVLMSGVVVDGVLL